MAYTKQTWIDNDPLYPLEDNRMMHIEDGIFAAAGTADSAASSAASAQSAANAAQADADAAQATANDALAASGGGSGGISPTQGGYYLDSFTGSDDQRLTAAIAAQQASGGTTNMAPIILPNRPLAFTTPRTLYSGCKIIGPNASGQKNPELSGGNLVGPEISLGGSISSGTSSWWNGTGSVYDVYMANFSVQGSQGSSLHQFLDQPSGTLYACEFHALSFNFMRGVFGRSDRKCLMTQVALTGSWTMNNAWDCQSFIGGSDCIFWMDSFNNVGTSSSPVQTGDVNRYYFKFDSLEATIGKAYLSTLNGWRGMLLSGNGNSIELHGGVYEGYKPTRIDGLLSGPGPGSQIKVTGGSVAMFGTKIGQGMDNPDGSESGLLQISGGEVSLHGVQFYGQNMGTANAVSHTAGRLYAAGIHRRQNEGGAWSGRPRFATALTAGTGANAFSCPDQSVAVV